MANPRTHSGAVTPSVTDGGSGSPDPERLAELEAEIRSTGLSADPDPERAAKRQRAFSLAFTSARCFSCDVTLDSEVYRLRTYVGIGFFGSLQRVVVPYCERCALEYVKSMRWRYAHLPEGPEPYDCEVCGRSVVQSEWRRRLPACSPRCARQLDVERRRQRRAAEKAARTKVCEECGETFTPERDDARYCPGGACKQRAYRRRKRAAA